MDKDFDFSAVVYPISKQTSAEVKLYIQQHCCVYYLKYYIFMLSCGGLRAWLENDIFW